MNKYIIALIVLISHTSVFAKTELKCSATKAFPYQIEIQSTEKSTLKVASIKRGKKLVYQDKVRVYDKSVQRDYS